MKYKVGSNQYSKKVKKDVGAYMIGFLYVMILMFALYDLSIALKPTKSEASEIKDTNVSVTQTADPAESMRVVATKVSTPAAILDPKPTQTEVEEYVKTIFGKDAKIAIAVSHVECNPKNKAYPKCVYHTEHEYSVGIFQINLFNKNHMIHAAKVPGKTIEEKIEALKDPYINTLVAYKIYSHSGFNPWSGYSSGRYLNNL